MRGAGEYDCLMSQVRAKIAGVHPVPFSDALLRRILEEWGHTSSDEGYAEALEEFGPQVRETMNGLCLIEMIIEHAPPEFCLDDVGQDREQTANSQVPYDEHWLDADGQRVIARDFSAPDMRPIRVAFFLHECQPSGQLFGPWGSLELPTLTPLPERLAAVVSYTPPG